MDLVTIVSLIAAFITVSTTIFIVYKRIKKFLNCFDERLIAIEDSFKVREELVLINDIDVKNKNNNHLYTLTQGTVVIVYDIQNDVVHFVTHDRLIFAESNIKNFIMRK